MTPIGRPCEDRLDRRELIARGAIGAAALVVAGCGGGGSGTTASRTARKPRQVAKPRRTSIGDLRTDVKGRVFAKGSPGYEAAAEVYNERYDGAHPLAIVEVSSEADVRTAVSWAGRRGVSVVPRSGGHSYAGYSTGDGLLVVDLSRLRSVAVDRKSGIATIGTGAQLIDVYSALAAKGLTIPAGSCPSVGAGGHVAVGGMGLAGRKLGLACDNLEALRIVTADGRLLTASGGSEPDLHWASRGGGAGNFGVATAYEMQTHPVTSVSFFNVSWPWGSASDALAAWQRLPPSAPDELTSIFHLSTGASPVVSANGQFFGPERKLAGLLRGLTESGGTLSSGTMGYLDMVRYWAGCSDIDASSCHTVGTRPGGTLPRSLFAAKSDYVSDPLPAAGRRALIDAIESRQRMLAGGSAAILFDSYGGAINQVAPDATAFVHRDELFCIQYLSYYPSDSALTGTEKWLDQTWQSMRPFASGMAYQGYIDPDLDGWQAAYYGSNYRRLQTVKSEYDPDFRFRYPQAVRPG